MFLELIAIGRMFYYSKFVLCILIAILPRALNGSLFGGLPGAATSMGTEQKDSDSTFVGVSMMMHYIAGVPWTYHSCTLLFSV